MNSIFERFNFDKLLASPVKFAIFFISFVIYFYLKMSASFVSRCSRATMIDSAIKWIFGRFDLSCENLDSLMNDAAKSRGMSSWIEGLVRARVRVISAGIGSCFPSTSLIYEHNPVVIVMPCRCADPAAGRCLIFPRLRGAGCKSNL